MKEAMAIELTMHPIGYDARKGKPPAWESKFTIPSDCKVGRNWSKFDKKVDPSDPMYNPEGLRDIEKGGREWLASISQAG
jgi:hypothetical protein